MAIVNIRDQLGRLTVDQAKHVETTLLKTSLIFASNLFLVFHLHIRGLQAWSISTYIVSVNVPYLTLLQRIFSLWMWYLRLITNIASAILLFRYC